MISVEKPGTPFELLHVGVKGMHWGVRKPEDLANHNERSKAYIKALPKNSKTSGKEAQKNIDANKKKFSEKFLPEGHKLTPEQKKLMIGVGVGIGALAVAGGSYYAYKKFGIKPKTISLNEFAGQHVDQNTFELNVQSSIRKTWSQAHGGYLQPSTFARPEFELPAGHTFWRFSHDVEKGFGSGTYAVDNIADRNRYMLAFGGTHMLTFKAKEAVKIPHVTTVLENLKDIMEESSGSKVSEKTVLKEYHRMSGGPWKYGNDLKLIERLKSKGYHGIVDEMDAGVYGDKPLVLFGDIFTKKVDNVISNPMVDEAVNNLTELSHRKL